MGVLRYLWNRVIDSVGGLLGSCVAHAVKRDWVHFPFLSQALAMVPFSVGWKFRKAVYSHLLPAIGPDAVLHWGVTIEDVRTTIGCNVWVSVGSYLDFVHIGNHVLVGPRAILLSGGHHHRFDRMDVPIKEQGNTEKLALEIGEGAWIGAGAVVMAAIGANAIIGAGSVVTRPIPADAIAAGNPARVLRLR